MGIVRRPRRPTLGGTPLLPPMNTPLAVVLGVLALIVLAGLGVLAAWPGARLPGWLGAELSAAVTLTVAVLLLVTTFAAYWSPRRHQQRSFAVIASVGLVAVTLPLGLTSYWHCSAGQAPGWTPMAWTIALFAGEVENPFGEAGGHCPVTMPLALQLARMTGPLAVFVGASAVLTALFRNQWDRRRARRASSVVVVAGVDASSLPLLKALRVQLPESCTLVLLEPDAGGPVGREARALGAVVVAATPTDATALRSVVRTGRHLSARTVYLLSSDTTANLDALHTLTSIADGTDAREDTLVPRFVVRLDDPWQAEGWRRQQLGQHKVYAVDAVGIHEATARSLGQRIRDEGDRVLLVGSSALALALLTELAQLERETAQLANTSVPLFEAVEVLDPEATDLVRDHDEMQRRFGHRAGGTVRPDPSPFRVEAVAAWIDRARADGRRPVVVFTEEPTPGITDRGTRIAVRRPAALVFSRVPQATGGPPRAVLPNLFLFGLTLAPEGRAPEDSWERVARLGHERYRHRSAAATSGSGAVVAWEELDDFYRQNNLRQVHSVLRRAVEQGRTWEPLPGDHEPLPFTSAELDAMAVAEHRSWLQYYAANGWRYGPQRDNERKVHHLLKPLEALDREAADHAVANTRSGVMDVLGLLQDLGYRPALDTQRWARFERRGEVLAERLDEPWTWATERGDLMQAAAGDWRITASDGRQWSVAAAIFDATYEPLGQGRFRRTGTVSARRATAGEVVPALEGKSHAGDDDWIVVGAAGEWWVVPDERFTASYLPVTGPQPPG